MPQIFIDIAAELQPKLRGRIIEQIFDQVGDIVETHLLINLDFPLEECFVRMLNSIFEHTDR